MYCGVATLTTTALGLNLTSNIAISIHALGSANLLSLAGCRMLFRLKDLGAISVDGDSSWQSNSFPLVPLRFNGSPPGQRFQDSVFLVGVEDDLETLSMSK